MHTASCISRLYVIVIDQMLLLVSLYDSPTSYMEKPYNVMSEYIVVANYSLLYIRII